MALVQVESEIDAARTAYTSGDAEPFQQHLKSAAELAGLSYKSLQDSGKSARRSPKWFKRAEQKLLKILRRVDSFVKDVSSEDRAAVEALRLRVSDIHDRILQDIMSKK